MENYYTDASGKIESIEFADGTVWYESDFILARIKGGGGDDSLVGASHLNDIFDSDAAAMTYCAVLAEMMYIGWAWGRVMTPYKKHYNNSGDTGDEIRIKSGIGVSDVRLARRRYSDDGEYNYYYDHLIIELYRRRRCKWR